jgi:hypothetical protein
MDHNQLMLITRTMPMKKIQVNGEDYLERYFVGELNGTQEWLHRFLRADSERHLHSHPWDADSTILCGMYVEQIQRPNGDKYEAYRNAGETNIITVGRLHRIIEVEANTWTHMRVYPGREPQWYFIDDNGVKTQVDTSPEDWYLSCKPRP